MYQEPLKIKVDKENNKVSLSIRASDFKVEVFEFSLPVFRQLIAEFNAILDGEFDGDWD